MKRGVLGKEEVQETFFSSRSGGRWRKVRETSYQLHPLDIEKGNMKNHQEKVEKSDVLQSN